jgi:hypothetical protein
VNLNDGHFLQPTTSRRIALSLWFLRADCKIDARRHQRKQGVADLKGDGGDCPHSFRCSSMVFGQPAARRVPSRTSLAWFEAASCRFTASSAVGPQRRRVIHAPTGTSVLREIAGASPCTPYRNRSTRSRRFSSDLAGCRSRWTGSTPFLGQALAGSVPHRYGFWPILSKETPDLLNKSTLPPPKTDKFGRLSKKLVKYRFLKLILCSVGIFIEGQFEEFRQQRIHVDTPLQA